MAILSKAKGITAASLVAAIGVVWGGQTTLDARYAMASDFQKMNVRVLIGQFWDRMDDLQESRQNGNVNREQDILEELTEILAEICETKPTFRYCATGIPE